MSINKLLSNHLDSEIKANGRKPLDARTAWKTFSSIYRLAEKSERFPGDVSLMFMAMSPKWARRAKLMSTDEMLTTFVNTPLAMRQHRLITLRKKYMKRIQSVYRSGFMAALLRAFFATQDRTDVCRG